MIVHPNTPEQIAAAVKLHDKHGSWEAVREAANRKMPYYFWLGRDGELPRSDDFCWESYKPA